jgi:hypothetical protein
LFCRFGTFCHKFKNAIKRYRWEFSSAAKNNTYLLASPFFLFTAPLGCRAE